MNTNDVLLNDRKQGMGCMERLLAPVSLQNLQRAGVVYKPLEDQTLYVKLAIVWRSANTSPVLHQFLAQSRAVTRFI
ncbi:MAG: hypothetical protein RM022_028635 [Nostoc sp. EfeVER01]|uniref:hypothetical protein n=1 Tax=Nostoc sp. EfeVER01 TaxID=3075406 RepID=UPI00391C476F